MDLVNSKERELSIPEIVSQAAATQSKSELPIQTILVAFVKEASMPDTEVKQYGNTVFITHFSKDKDLAVGRALNMDIAKNFVYNGTEYLRDLVRGGTTKFVAQFDQKSFATAFTILKRTPVTTDMKMWVVDTPKGKTQVRIALDGELT